MATGSGPCATVDCMKQRRANRQGGYSRFCSACEWAAKKAAPTRHAAARRQNRHASARYRATPKRARAIARHYRKKIRSGKRGWVGVWACLSQAEWVALWEHQDGRCAICRTLLQNRYASDPVGAVAACDHGHAHEKALAATGLDPLVALRRSIRGLLCAWCNVKVLGTALRDDAQKARRAADYLDDPPARRVIDLNAEPCNRGTGMLR